MFEYLKYFHFIRPYWLLLIPVVLFVYWRFQKNQNIKERYQKLIAPHLLNHLVVGEKRKWNIQPIHMILIIVTIGAFAFAGPTWKRELPPFTEDKAPLTIVLSLSESMDAIDISPTRLERAKQKIIDLLKLRPGARTALFVYAEETFMVLPLTTDSKMFEIFLSSLSTDLMPKDGSNTKEVLNRVSEFLRDEEVPGTILLITDKVNRDSFNSFTELKDSSHNQIIILATGTSSGGPISIGQNRFQINKNGQRIIAKLDIDSFKELRDKHNIPVTTVSIDNDDIEWIQRNVQTHLQAVQQEEAETRWIEYGYYLLYPIVLIFLFWFRKGWSVKWVAIFIISMLINHSSLYAFEKEGLSDSTKNFADSTATIDEDQYKWEWFMNLWLTKDQQGRYYFEKNDYTKAAERFENKLWKGISFYKIEDYEEAINQFAQLNDAQSYFYLGNSYARLKNYEEAKNSYKEAIIIKGSFPEAEFNLRIVEGIIRKLEEEKKKEDERQSNDPTFRPDEIKFDDKGKKGKEGEVEELKLSPEKMADIWMRNIQTSPADFLRRKFYIQSESKK